jgi:hypothetical protein
MYNYMKKADNFNPGQWLVENKLTTSSKLLKENTVKGIDLDIVKQALNDPSTQKLAQQFKSNPELAKKAAKFVADAVDGKIKLDGTKLTEISTEDYLKSFDSEKTTIKGKIKQILNSAGIGIAFGTVMGFMLAAPSLNSPQETLQWVLCSIGASLIMGLGIGAAATDGFQRKLEEGDENLADKIEQIIAMGKEL